MQTHGSHPKKAHEESLRTKKKVSFMEKMKHSHPYLYKQ